MPIYEYFCADCHTKFEALRPMRQADEPIDCEHCRSHRTGRVLSVFFAHSDGGAVAAAGGGCACGGRCACGHSPN